MNCLIVDDNKMARSVLRHQINEVDFLNLVAECEDVMQATDILNKEKIDLMLLDVQMPEISGIDFLKNTPQRPHVILITSRPEYAIEAFEYNVVDYILKPVMEDRLMKALLRVKEIYERSSKTFNQEKEYFFFREKGVISKLMISDILYIQALGDYITIQTHDKKHVIHYTLTAIEKELPAEKFLRVHRSYIAALNKIETLESGTAYIQQYNIPVSDKQYSTLMTRLNLL